MTFCSTRLMLVSVVFMGLARVGSATEPVPAGDSLASRSVAPAGDSLADRSVRRPLGHTKDGMMAVRNACSGCHRETTPGHFDRISDMRKTPEGWAMTLFRMHQAHGLELDPAQRDTVLRYLSDVSGLAPAEAAAGRFALERRPDAQDLSLGEDMRAMCGRCHSLARVALQRRDANEWLKLTHTHVGQWPSLEYQASGRDRYWWQSATTEYPAKLAALFPFDTPQWREWSKRAHASFAGRWIVCGHTPGRGDYHGIATITKQDGDEYSATYSLTYSDGSRLDGSSKAVVYTGYEWRGSATVGGESVKEVFAASEDGSLIKGRWFLEDHAEVGSDWNAVRSQGAPAILALLPRALRLGTTQSVTVVGRGLEGGVSFGPGTRAAVVSRTADGVTVNVTVDAQAAPGLRNVEAGKANGRDLAVVYHDIDRVEVEPAYAIARLGGGKIAPVSAQFEAIGYSNAGIRLGVVPVAWSVAPHDAQAGRAQDVRFAGTVDQSGRFSPAGAGPNPAREFSGNNVGDLFVVATVKDAAHELQGKSHLVVTVQRWNTPPIY